LCFKKYKKSLSREGKPTFIIQNYKKRIRDLPGFHDFTDHLSGNKDQLSSMIYKGTGSFEEIPSFCHPGISYWASGKWIESPPGEKPLSVIPEESIGQNAMQSTTCIV
jgi:hypothetical protein